jgi:hypothetical protein
MSLYTAKNHVSSIYANLAQELQGALLTLSRRKSVSYRRSTANVHGFLVR